MVMIMKRFEKILDKLLKENLILGYSKNGENKYILFVNRRFYELVKKYISSSVYETIEIEYKILEGVFKAW